MYNKYYRYTNMSYAIIVIKYCINNINNNNDNNNNNAYAYTMTWIFNVVCGMSTLVRLFIYL